MDATAAAAAAMGKWWRGQGWWQWVSGWLYNGTFEWLMKILVV